MTPAARARTAPIMSIMLMNGGGEEEKKKRKEGWPGPARLSPCGLLRPD